jgi:hypothetical protein
MNASFSTTPNVSCSTSGTSTRPSSCSQFGSEKSCTVSICEPMLFTLAGPPLVASTPFHGSAFALTDDVIANSSSMTDTPCASRMKPG